VRLVALRLEGDGLAEVLGEDGGGLREGDGAEATSDTATFAFATAFRRERGLSPGRWRVANRA
jgi:hypothetical protein